MDDGGSRHVRGIGVDNAQTDANFKLVPPSADFFFKLGKRVVVVVVRVRVRVWARPTATSSSVRRRTNTSPEPGPNPNQDTAPGPSVGIYLRT